MGGAAGGTTTAAERGGNSARPPGRSAGTPPPPGRTRRLPRWVGLLLGALALVGLAGFTAWALYGSSWLRLERIAVTGTDKLTADEVREAAALTPGTPLISLDKGAVERRLTDRLRRIDSVEVVRNWPRAVGLKVVERTPQAVMRRSGGAAGYHEVDAKGVRYATVAQRPAGVPLLVLDLDRAARSQRFPADRLRAEAVTVAAQLPAAVRKDTRTVRVRSFDSITLELSGNRMVMWGSSEYGAAKAASLRALLKAHGKGSGAGYFDVSVPSAPAVSGS